MSPEQQEQQEQEQQQQQQEQNNLQTPRPRCSRWQARWLKNVFPQLQALPFFGRTVCYLFVLYWCFSADIYYLYSYWYIPLTYSYVQYTGSSMSQQKHKSHQIWLRVNKLLLSKCCSQWASSSMSWKLIHFLHVLKKVLRKLVHMTS